MPANVSTPTARFLRSGPMRLCLAWLLLVLTVACGGAGFERAGNARKYRPLPLGTEVKIAAAAQELPQPVEVLGTMRVTTKGDPANRVEAENVFRNYAARYGCDAVTDVASNRREVKATRRNRSLGANGVPVYTDEVIVNAEHDWTAQCVRTAEAPADGLPPAAARKELVEARPEPKPEPTKVDPVRNRNKVARKPPVEVEPEPKPDPRPVVVKPEPKPEPKPDPHPMVAKPEPRPPLVKPEPKPEPKPVEEARPVPALDTGDPKLASEVARFFLAWSDALVKSNTDKICAAFDETVFIDVSSSQPRLRIKQEFPAEAACESVKNGELAAYVRDFGPAEVHAEASTLIPTLFRIHGGAYLKLDDAAQKRYAEALVKDREGKKALACTMYNVLPAENLFKVSLTCGGVQSFRVLLKRTGENQFKVMQLNHVRP
jgi:hypothetical protein